MEEHVGENRELGPTYKSLFLGACLIIGGTVGWWITNFVATVEHFTREHERRLAELEARAARETWERESLQQELKELRNHTRRTDL